MLRELASTVTAAVLVCVGYALFDLGFWGNVVEISPWDLPCKYPTFPQGGNVALSLVSSTCVVGHFVDI